MAQTSTRFSSFILRFGYSEQSGEPVFIQSGEDWTRLKGANTPKIIGEFGRAQIESLTRITPSGELVPCFSTLLSFLCEQARAPVIRTQTLQEFFNVAEMEW